MKHSIIVFSLVFATACSAAPADSDASGNEYDKVEQPDLIPSELRGLWAESNKDCADQYATSWMKIGANWISFYESYGLMQISTPAGIPDIDESLAANFIMSGEGSTWTNDLVFGWNKSKPAELFLIEGKTPDSMTRGRKRERYVRCP